MSIALLHTFSPDRKEPLATLLARIHGAFSASGLGEPELDFTFADHTTEGFASSVDRVLKRHPDLQRFLAVNAPSPHLPPVRRLTNATGTPAAGDRIAFAKLHEIAAGVPKSFPFQSVVVRFRSPAFGDEALVAGNPVMAAAVAPGVLVADNWWINGRMRALTARAVVDADAAGKPLPLPPAVATVLAACGKAKGTTQLPLGGEVAPGGSQPAAPAFGVALAVETVVADFRRRFDEVLDRARLPHDLPSPAEAEQSTPLGQSAGSKKPVLVRAFKPLGYECRFESGEYTLRRRSRGDLGVEVSLDVGTWSRTLHASYSVSGSGFRAAVPLAVTKGMSPGSGYKIGDAARWQQIVDNLAALVAELDRSFVPAVEAAAGAAP